MFQQDIFQGPGTGTFTSHTFEILLMLAGAFLFGLWFGWILWSRFRQAAEKLRLDNESLNATVGALRSDLDGLKMKLAEAETGRSTLATQLQNQNWENENYRGQITILESDLGKVQERNRQLETELGLAQHPEAHPEAVPFEVTVPHPGEEPEEWPGADETESAVPLQSIDQANADMPGLADAVAEAVFIPEPEQGAGHRETEMLELLPLPVMDEPVISPPASDVVAPLPEPPGEPLVAAVSTGPRDDLKIVEGIGPKIEELLFAAGITTYGQLAATSVQQLKGILDTAGSRFAMHDPGTWSAQALLAANGEWENLKAYQDFLNAGKRPDK